MQRTRKRTAARMASLASAMAMVLVVAAPAMAGGASTFTIDEPFQSGVLISENPETVGLMECDLLKRVVNPDGSSKETQTCQLTGDYLVFDGPGDPFCTEPECGPPDRAARTTGGGCFTWASDWYLVTFGGPDFNELEHVVFADRAHTVVTPSGRVHATTWYGAEPLTLGSCLEE